MFLDCERKLDYVEKTHARVARRGEDTIDTISQRILPSEIKNVKAQNKTQNLIFFSSPAMETPPVEAALPFLLHVCLEGDYQWMWG